MQPAFQSACELLEALIMSSTGARSQINHSFDVNTISDARTQRREHAGVCTHPAYTKGMKNV